MKKILFSFIILFACAAVSMADAQPSRVPASPFPIKVSQPNGDTIMIRVMGDEWKHFHTTTDGYVIVKNSNLLNSRVIFAIVDSGILSQSL